MKRNQIFLLLLTFGCLVSCKKKENAMPDLKTGLVAYYPFNSNAKDESGNGHDGVIYLATLTTDRKGNSERAFSFNGADNFISIGNLPVSQQVTISVWCYPELISSSNQCIVNIDGSYAVAFYDNKIVAQTKSSSDCTGAWPTKISSLNVSVNSWYHIVWLRHADGYQKLFLNNQIAYEGIQNSGQIPNNCSLPKSIGAASNFSTILDFFKGKIDDVRIYNRALTMEEVQQLYNE